MKKRTAAAAAAAVGTIGAGLLLTLITREPYLNWGATKEEEAAPLPGDEYAPSKRSTRAITIHAPVEEVWQGLAKIGQSGVLAVEANRYIVLEAGSAFVLKPIDETTTRLIIRAHGPRKSGLRRFLDVLLLDPLDFLIERSMLLGIKERAERHAA